MKKTNPTTEDFLNAAPWFLIALMIAAIMLAGCTQYQRAQSKAWWQLHGSQVGQTAVMATVDVGKIAAVAAWTGFLESKDPAATQDWNQYFQQSLWQNAPSILTYSTMQKYYALWKTQSPKLQPVADAFSAAWVKANPQNEAQAKQFCLDFANGVYSATTVIGNAYK